MSLGTRFYGATPLVSLLVADSIDTVVFVAGAVLVVLALLATVLIVWKGVAPWMEWGRLKLGFTPLGRTRAHPPPADESRAPPRPRPSAGHATDIPTERGDHDSTSIT